MLQTYWRKNAVLERILIAVNDNTCGELRSLRFSWARPRKLATSEHTFLYETLAAAIDGAKVLAKSDFSSFFIEKAAAINNLFAILQFQNGIVAEFELNETLSNSMFDICSLKADFSGGHVSNRPLVGHLNEEGMLLAFDDILSFPIAENCGLPYVNGPIEAMLQRYLVSGAAELEDDSEIKSMIEKALRK